MKSAVRLFVLVLLLVLRHEVTAYADGFIVLPEPLSSLSTPYPLQVVYHHVDVAIDGIAAVTTVEQEFFNPLNNRIEGYYLFPVPRGAAISRFNVSVDGADSVVELLDAAKARSIYEEIVRKQKDPALLEYAGNSLFRVRIYPIEARSRKKVRLVYAEVLARDNDVIEYLYPLNTEKFSAGDLDEVSVKVAIAPEAGAGNVYSPSHNVEIVRRSGAGAMVSYREKKVRPDRDFRLFCDMRKTGTGAIVRTYRTPGNEGFFLVNIGGMMPAVSDRYIARDMVFVLDTSGSMRGEKLEQAKKALLFCVRNLNSGDRFQVVSFSNEAVSLFEEVKPPDRPALEKAEKFINDLEATGGTNIQDALSMAFRQYGNRRGRPCVVVFITDGKPTIGETDEETLLSLTGKMNDAGTRVFTFGIGHDINTRFLDHLTEQTRSFRTYIGPSDNIETVISAFYNKIRSPVLSDCRIAFEGADVSMVYPADMPDLFSGSSVTLCGRYNGHGPAGIVLSGNDGNAEKKFLFRTVFPETDETDSYIPQIWASRRIGYLLDMLRLHGERKQIIDEIVSLAREYGIVTPYTSYLILEDEDRRVRENSLQPMRRTFGGSGNLSPEWTGSMKNNYHSLHRDSGKDSIQASMEVQNMRAVENVAQQIQSSGRIFYRDNGSADSSMIQQMKYVGGRAIYQNGSYWIDPHLQDGEKRATLRIRFAGKEFFRLIETEPGIVQYLSLGRNIRFIYKNTEYEIYE